MVTRASGAGKTTITEPLRRALPGCDVFDTDIILTPVAVAASTLAAAALFGPLRRRVQLVVDRRFDRARYDGDQTATAFAARLKDAVDLDSVCDDLTAVVTKALEPVHVSVWIRRQG